MTSATSILKAYMCRSDAYEACDIIFAETRGKASWQFIRHWCEGDFVDQTARRAPAYDKYGSMGNIPASVLVWDGWYFECHHCGESISEGTLDDLGMTPDSVIGTVNGAVYCSEQCRLGREIQKEHISRIENQVLRNLTWRLEDKFGVDNVTEVKHHTYIRDDGKIVEAYVDVNIAPFTDFICSFGYKPHTDEPVSLAEFTRMPTQSLRMPAKMRDDFIKHFELLETFP